MIARTLNFQLALRSLSDQRYCGEPPQLQNVTEEYPWSKSKLGRID
jgi:hypothetical protein